MSAATPKRRGSRALLALTIIVACALLACVGLCGYVIALEEVVEPQRRAEDPKYAAAQDAARLARERLREADRLARQQAKRDQEAQQVKRQLAAQAHELELLERELESARGHGRLERVALKPPMPSGQGPRVKATPDGLTLREGQREALGWTYKVLRSDPVTSFALVVDVAQLTPGLEEESVELIVGFAGGLASVSMTYEEVRWRQGQRTRGYLLARPDRQMIGPVHMQGQEPKRRVLRVEVHRGQARAWVNGHEQLLGSPRSRERRSGVSAWRPEALQEPSPVTLSARFYTHGEDNPFQREGSVTIRSVHLYALP